MPASRIHLIRHGEVHNPDGVLYGRLPHFALSEAGHKMAATAAQELVASKAKITHLYTSPLLRTRESSEPIKDAFGLEPAVDERLIEPYNIFEGKRVSAGTILLRPNLLFHLRNPSRPSWGEPYEAVLERMMSALNHIADEAQGDEVAVVTHQLPIWMVHLHLAGENLPHNPRQRRCGLSSITTVERDGKGIWSEVSYREPAAAFYRAGKDQGAV
jgi:broad specificity phosphatase PhoE